jgi:hypothetical protein
MYKKKETPAPGPKHRTPKSHKTNNKNQGAGSESIDRGKKHDNVSEYLSQVYFQYLSNPTKVISMSY